MHRFHVGGLVRPLPALWPVQQSIQSACAYSIPLSAAYHVTLLKMYACICQGAEIAPVEINMRCKKVQ